jgi:Ankyrin repeats (3 copies)
VNATSRAYGGQSTALGLASTSIHPEQAGVQIALLETLLAFGADIEQPGQAGNQHTAVNGCLANGQGDAAQFLAGRGAQLDLEAAAGVGSLDVVKTYFDGTGKLRNGATRQQFESGFLYACGYGRIDVVRYLLERGADPGTRNDVGQTGLHWAAYGPHINVVKALIEAGAPVNVADAQQSTPIDWAIWASVAAEKAEERQPGYEMVARLIRAGATVDLQRIRSRVRERAQADPRLMAALRGEFA